MSMTVNYNNASNSEEAYNIAKAQITPEYIAKWNVKADVKFDDSNKEIEAKGKGFTLGLKFEDSCCAVSYKFSLLLKPLKKKILTTLEQKLERHI